jgi:hypothetical protein
MTHRATYSPEDDKIRLFFSSRIPREEWDQLKAAGFSWTMKQNSDMVAHWSVAREDIALEMCGEIEDEDQPMAERSADRAERFAGYGDKRESDAETHAERYENGPTVHGHQSEARAERAAKAQDRHANKAATNWSKAEYWTERTARVIGHALYKDRAEVRHRRIKGLESELRVALAAVTPRKPMEGVETVRRYCGDEAVAKGHDCVALFGLGRGAHPRSYNKAAGIIPSEHHSRTVAHLRLRIDYEKQMLSAQGGTMADAVEMEPGGFYGKMQIQKVTKDRAGLVSRVYFIGPHPYKEGVQSLHGIDAETLQAGKYRAPTDEERAAWNAEQKAIKACKPKAPPLINPTMEEARKLQAVWNEARAKARRESHVRQGLDHTKPYCTDEIKNVLAVQPREMTQEQYTARSETYGPCKTLEIAADWEDNRRGHLQRVPCAFRVRVMSASSDGLYNAPHVVVITNKPQAALPAQELTNASATA